MRYTHITTEYSLSSLPIAFRSKYFTVICNGVKASFENVFIFCGTRCLGSIYGGEPGWMSKIWTIANRVFLERHWFEQQDENESLKNDDSFSIHPCIYWSSSTLCKRFKVSSDWARLEWMVRTELWDVYQVGGGLEAEKFGLYLISSGEPLTIGCSFWRLSQWKRAWSVEWSQASDRQSFDES